jgi:hypothetical protein
MRLTFGACKTKTQLRLSWLLASIILLKFDISILTILFCILWHLIHRNRKIIRFYLFITVLNDKYIIISRSVLNITEGMELQIA